MAENINTPYESLPERQFWRPAVADRGMFEIADLWRPKFPITKSTAFATYGSCFAQHIGQALRDSDFNWLVTEPAPRVLSPDSAKAGQFRAVLEPHR